MTCDVRSRTMSCLDMELRAGRQTYRRLNNRRASTAYADTIPDPSEISFAMRSGCSSQWSRTRSSEPSCVGGQLLREGESSITGVEEDRTGGWRDGRR